MADDLEPPCRICGDPATWHLRVASPTGKRTKCVVMHRNAHGFPTPCTCRTYKPSAHPAYEGKVTA